MRNSPQIMDPDFPQPAAGLGETSGPAHNRENRLIWSASEGQVTNAGTFVLCLLFSWLILPVLYAAWCWARTATHRYDLTDQRLIVTSGIFVKRIESLELYRVKDMHVEGSLLQTIFGRGQILLQTSDISTPVVALNAIPSPATVLVLLREQVEICRAAKHVRAFDY